MNEIIRLTLGSPKPGYIILFFKYLNPFQMHEPENNLREVK